MQILHSFFYINYSDLSSNAMNPSNARDYLSIAGMMTILQASLDCSRCADWRRIAARQTAHQSQALRHLINIPLLWNLTCPFHYYRIRSHQQVPEERNATAEYSKQTG
jgi:hypothetical protein